MSERDDPKEVILYTIDSETSALVPYDPDQDKDEGDSGEGGSWWEDGSTRIKYEDPFKNYELLSDLSKHHQNYADRVQAAVEPDPQSKNTLSNNFGMENKSEFLPHPLLAGKPYFNGMDPKTTPLPDSTQLTDSPEYNNARNELKMKQQLRNEKKLQNTKERTFNPRPDGM